MKRGPKSKYSHITDDQIKDACESFPTMKQAAEYLGMPGTSFTRWAKILGVYKPNQGGKGVKYKSRSNNSISLNEILDGKYPTYLTNRLKKRLIKEGIKEDKCESCGLVDIWNGKPITLQLDHINGINYDHRLENLQILCPNCHSQTDTYCGRNKKS